MPMLILNYGAQGTILINVFKYVILHWPKLHLKESFLIYAGHQICLCIRGYSGLFQIIIICLILKENFILALLFK